VFSSILPSVSLYDFMSYGHPNCYLYCIFGSQQGYRKYKEHHGAINNTERKQEIVLAMEKRINEISTTIQLYSDVYDYVDDMETWHIPDSDIMPLKGDILRNMYFKKHKLETKKKKQERLLAVVKALKTTADDYEEGDEDLRGRHHMSSEEVLDLFQVNPKRTKR
jgi:hypothetical protein